MSENKNTIRDQVSRVEKMKQTKLRNREIKLLKKQSKENAELKEQLKELQIEKAKYFNEAKKLQKEKVIFKQKEEKYNYYNKMPLQKTREERMNKLLTDINGVKLPESTTRNREKFDRTALNGAFQERTLYNNDDSINENNMGSIIKKALTDAFLRNDNSKFTIYGNICISYIMEYKDEKAERFFNVHSERLTSFNQINELTNSAVSRLEEETTACVNNSNGTYQGVNFIKVQTMKNNKTRAGSYIIQPEK